MEKKDMFVISSIKALETFFGSLRHYLTGDREESNDIVDVEVEEKGEKDDSPKNTDG